MTQHPPHPTHPPHHLVAALEPRHLGDVKAVLAIGDGWLASASRDSSVAVWKRVEADKAAGAEVSTEDHCGKSGIEGNSATDPTDSKDGQDTDADAYSDNASNSMPTPFELKALLRGHDSYINALAHIPGTDDKLGHIASGGNSSVILLHSLDALEPEAEAVLIGHLLNVCALSFNTKSGKLLSGSWDKTARVWGKKDTGWECERVLEGHTQAVWDVQAIEEGERAGCILTAAADNMIFLWSPDGELISRFKGCPEPVRSLAVLPGGIEFASACNDGYIRIYDMRGSVLAKLPGHGDYVYQVRYNAAGHLLSVGEDHALRVWNRKGEQEVVLLHPCVTVWTVTSFSDGTVVTGGSDGVVRVWGTGPAVTAKDATSNMTQQAESLSGTDPEPTPAPTTGGAEADAAARDDEPNDAPAPEAAQRLEIDIDLADDEPPVTFVYESSQDPREAAVAFGKQNGLSDTYIDRIEEFVRSHLHRG